MLSEQEMIEFNLGIYNAKTIRHKTDYKWCQVINWIWNIFSKRKDDFLIRASTVGHHIYVGKDWDIAKTHPAVTYVMIKHELQHIYFFETYGPILGLLLYLFFPLPLGLAYFRYRSEREAIVEELAAIYLLGGDYRKVLENYVLGLAGWNYFFAWPFKNSIRRWLRYQLRMRHNIISNG